MKKKLLLSILSLTGTIVLAQSPAQKSVTVSLGAGISSTQPALKRDARIGNGYQINGDIFIPFLHKGSDKFTLGIIAGGEYNSANNLMPDAAPTQSAYKLYTGNLDILSAQKGSSHNAGFTGFGGLQADLTFGKIILSPSISGAYFSLTQDGFSQSSQVMVNGTTQTVVLSESSQTKRNGFITRPQLKVGYPLTSNLSFYAAGTLNIGPIITSNKSQLVPSGGFNANNTYEANQLITGSRENLAVETRYQTISVNAGFSWSFGSGSNSSRRLKGKITRPGDGGMRSSALAEGNPIGGIIIKGGKNPGGSTITITTNDKGEFELKGLEASDYKFTVTAPEEPAGKSINEKGISSTKGRPKNMVFAPGNPIGGIIVKGGKNPGGSTITITTNDKGEFELKGLEAGDYKFTVTAPEEPAGKSINEKGISSTKGRPKNMVFAPGNPIGGIIVKGGKNPGGSTITITTNDKGEFELKRLEAGDYKFTVTAPEEPAGKSINEKGISSTKGRPKNMVFAPGNPIGGIIVKGGKNPGGSTITITTNDKGEFELKGLEAGDYKFTTIVPEQSGKGHSEKGIK